MLYLCHDLPPAKFKLSCCLKLKYVCAITPLPVCDIDSLGGGDVTVFLILDPENGLKVKTLKAVKLFHLFLFRYVVWWRN